MSDAFQFRVDLGGSGDMAVGEMAEVEFDAALKAPVQRNLVDGRGRSPSFMVGW